MEPRLALALAVAGLGAAAVVAAAQAGTAHSPALLPDLRAVAPDALVIEERGGRRLLGFGSATENVGAGPLAIEGQGPSGSGEMSVDQVLTRRDGSSERRPLAAALRYERLPDHAHWHLEDFMRYELRRARDGRLVGIARKAGFCLGDRYQTDPATPLPGTPRVPPFIGTCGFREPGRTRLIEGISVGHGDYYPEYLDGQFIDITGVRPGRYRLVNRVNPERALTESDYSNNSASLALTIDPT